MKKLYSIIVLLGLCVTAEAQYVPRPPSVTSLTLTGNSTSSYSGTASTPAFKFSGVPFAGTGTTSFPLVYVNDANATASTTLNTAGTYLGVNGDGSQDLLHLLKDGVTRFRLDSSGIARFGQTVSSGYMQLSPGSGSSLSYIEWFKPDGSRAGYLGQDTSTYTTLTLYTFTTFDLASAGIKIGGGTELKLVKSATATLDFTSTAAQTSAELTITVTGAADGDDVIVSPPNGSNNANTCFTARVSSANTVSVKFNNFSSGAIDPASGTFRVTLLQF